MTSPAVTANSTECFVQQQAVNRESTAFGKVWRWIKENHQAIIITTISFVAAVAIVAGFTFLTVAFPYAMIPVYICAGAGAVLTTALFAGFAVGGH